MEVGVLYPVVEAGGVGSCVREFGVTAEKLGYSFIVAWDHVLGAKREGDRVDMHGPFTEENMFHDPLITLTYLAAVTERIGLTTAVLVLPQRQTALVARQTADVDILSDGRLRLGIGVGYNWVEFEALGFDFHTRGRRMTEQIELLRRYWREPLVSFEGEFDRVDRAAINPRPQRDIPIWMGGYGPPAIKRAVAMGDGFIFSGSVEECAEKLQNTRQELERIGRDPNTFGADLNIRGGSPAEIAANVAAWEAAGGTHATVRSIWTGLRAFDDHLEFITTLASELF